MIGAFIDKDTKSWEILTKWGKFWVFFHKNMFYQSQPGTDICYKNESRKLWLGLDVLLYSF